MRWTANRVRAIAMAPLAAALLLAGGELPAQQEVQRLTVLTDEEPIRGQPSFFSNLVVRVPRGTAVDILGEQRGWAQVRVPGGATGWMHRSALTERQYEIRSTGRTTASAGTSPDEITLAAKGFNPDVERADRASATDANYDAVDRLEAWGVTAVDTETVQAFMQEGQLSSREDGP